MKKKKNLPLNRAIYIEFIVSNFALRDLFFLLVLYNMLLFAIVYNIFLSAKFCWLLFFYSFVCLFLSYFFFFLLLFTEIFNMVIVYICVVTRWHCLIGMNLLNVKSCEIFFEYWLNLYQKFFFFIFFFIFFNKKGFFLYSHILLFFYNKI